MTGSLRRAGAENFVLQAMGQLANQGVQSDFVVWHDRPDEQAAAVAAMGGHVFEVPRPRGRDLHRWIRAFDHIVAAGYDVVHTHVHHFNALPLSRSRAAKVPVRIAHSHLAEVQQPWPRRQLDRVLSRRVRQSATHLIGCTTAASLSLFGKGIERDPRHRIVSNAFDVDRFSKVRSGIPYARLGLDLPTDAFVVGHIGRFEEQKNHRMLVEIFSQIRAWNSDAYLVLAGDGHLRDEILATCMNRGIGDRVRWLGIIADVPAALAAFDVFLFPSLYEGLGIVLLEAQAAGVPCVTSTSVPAEANLGLGLYEALPLDAPTGAWAETVLRAPPRQTGSEEEVRLVCEKRGMTLDTAAAALLDVYRSGLTTQGYGLDD